jgi:hypothetical protein
MGDYIEIDGKQRKITTRKDRYQMIWFNSKNYYLHRYIAERHIPNPNNLPCVNHIDGNPSNNSISNLEWVTYLENNVHAKQNGLWGKNILDKRKLNDIQIQEIKQKYIPHKYSMYKLAEEYGVDYRTIWNVVNNKSYTKEYLNNIL